MHVVHEIKRIAAERIIEPKVLLCQNIRGGHQWLESVVRSGQPVVNCRVLTITGFALELAGPQLADQGKELLSPAAGILLVDLLLGSTTTQYLEKSNRSPNLAAAVLRSIHDIRLSACDANELPPNAFEADQKCRDMQSLLDGYARQLKAWNAVDEADLLTIALNRLRDDSTAIPNGTLILIPDVLHPSGLAQALLEAIPPGKRIAIHGQSENSQSTSDLTDRALLRLLNDVPNAPAPVGDGTVEIFRAVGASNEVREVFRRIARDELPLDEVELLHTNTNQYVPLVYELTHRLMPDEEARAGIPVTFAEGIPTSYGRPGRALRAWLSWMEQDFDQQSLVRMLHDGLIVVDTRDGDLSMSSLAATLRQIGVGWGHERYLPKITEQLDAARARLVSARESTEVDAENDVRQIMPLERRVARLESVLDVVTRLLELSHDHTASRNPLEQAIEFLTKFSRTAGEVDSHARDALIGELRALQNWSKLVDQESKIDYRPWLRQLPDHVRVLGSGPKPGHLHVANARTGGNAGRRQTFVIGLDDRRFPGAAAQDPLLLDRERTKLDPRLVTSSRQLEQQLAMFIRKLAESPGRLTLSFPCWDLVDDRALFPSSIVLSAYRLITGDHEATLATLEDGVPPAASFAARGEGEELSESDWWLSALCGENISNKSLAVVESRYPHLGRGRKALEARHGHHFTEFDGFVPAAGIDFHPTESEKVFSASALEVAGQCPLKYFFRYPLHIRPLDELVADPGRWLDPMSYGILLHSVFRQFMSEVRDRNELPEFSLHERRMAKILQEHIRDFRERIPPPNEAAFRNQCRELRFSALVFLESESKYCRTHRPVFFEASIGLPAEGVGTELDRPDPVAVVLPSGKAIRTWGRVDRIDLVGPSAGVEYSICDYKTGSSWKYDEADPFRQGRVVQNILYVAMVEPTVQETIDRNARVREFGFFFPGSRTWGERVTWNRRQLEAGRDVVHRLSEVIGNGAFVGTDAMDDCRYCDYVSVCGDLVQLTKSTRTKIDNRENTSLEPIKELRRP